ncbi:MAG TPA: SRPBCC family protein [Mycobacteriales bacterium]|jgi:uncharacterized protein YndB with AHSA1/START domain|nr:SRPBCC family protein [Mycobacteriales bacterium]HET7406313.1 SRPBCC family protein [Mycobacteriales bacterium]HEU5356121.1 SRPBCC family protein [Actinocrinis sp.]
MTSTRRIPRSGEVGVTVPAPADAVWRVLSDVTRTGEWSHECHQVRWLGAATAARPGTRFRGRNRSGWMRWSRVCEILAVDPPRELVWRTLATPTLPDSTEWRIRLEPDASGTRIVQSYQVTKLPRWLELLLAMVNPSHRDRTQALAQDLQRLGEIAAPSASRHR